MNKDCDEKQNKFLRLSAKELEKVSSLRPEVILIMRLQFGRVILAHLTDAYDFL